MCSKERHCAHLNAKQRAIGIDPDALAQICAEHESAREEEKALSAHEARNWEEINKVIAGHDRQQQIAKNEADRALSNDWRSQCKNRPKLVKSSPIVPETCAVGAAQYFTGEDKNEFERNRMQKAQMRDWCLKGKAQLSEADELKKLEDAADAENNAQINRFLVANAQSSATATMNDKYEVQNYNRLLAQEKKLKMKHEALLQKQVDEWEVNNAMSSGLLAEDPRPGYTPWGRKRGDHWKGMQEEEVQEIYRENAVQMEENRRKKAAEAAADAGWKMHFDAVDATMREMETADDGAVQARYALNNDHLHQRKEHRKKEQDMKNIFTTNIPTDDFYSSFGGKCNGKPNCPYAS